MIDWEAARLRPPEEAIPEPGPGAWWVAHTRPRAEKALAEDLARLDLRFYLPVHRRVTRSPRTARPSRSIVPVFTSYVFLLVDEAGRQRALKTQRIVSTLPVRDQARLVRELRNVQSVLSTSTHFEWGPPLERGDWVRVLAGPLAGVEGIVEQRRARARLVLTVQMLSQSVVVELDRDLLQRIDPPPQHA